MSFVGSRRCLLAFVALITVSTPGARAHAQKNESPDAFLFSYFTKNGDSGMYLAYSRDGVTWLPVNNARPMVKPAVIGAGVGWQEWETKAALMRDPSIKYGPDEMFHMVWTIAWSDKGIGEAHSKDLINWSEQTRVPVMDHEPDALNAWAPDLFYDDVEKQYVIVFASAIPGRFPATDSLAQNTSKGRADHRLYFTTTKDFKTYSKTALLYDGGFAAIDGTIARVGDTYFLVMKDETFFPERRNLRVASAPHATGPYGRASPSFTDLHTEGPSILQSGGYWYVYYDEYTRGHYGAVRTKDFENWEAFRDSLKTPRGIRHGSAFLAPKSVLEKLLSLDSTAATLPSSQLPLVGAVDWYGARTVSKSALDSALNIKRGDAVNITRIEDLLVMEARLMKVPGVVQAQVRPVCCENGRTTIYVGIRESGSHVTEFAPVKPASGKPAALAADVLKAAADFDVALNNAVQHGDFAEDHDAGYALMHDPAARAVQTRFVQLAAQYERALEQTILSSPDASQRAIAAQILAYAPLKQTGVSYLTRAMRDSDSEVRNNATRALWIIAAYVQKNRGLPVTVSYAPFIALLNSLVWTDRNKSSLALMELSASRDAGLLRMLKTEALDALVDIARWHAPGHATPGIVMLGRIAGMSEQEIGNAIEQHDVEEVIARARAKNP